MDEKEKAIIVGLDLGNDPDFEYDMEELAELVKACDMEVIETIIQRNNLMNKALYIGQGKVEEVRESAQQLGADMIVFNEGLSPMQIRNLQSAIGLPILDRTSLILEIFSQRAKTREAKVQVETARLQYILPRLAGMHAALSRQGGAGSGGNGGSSLCNRGAGEQKKELDRRYIEGRLQQLKRELEEIGHDKDVQRKKRDASQIPKVALVGYTNAGKSTLMNQMIEACNVTEEKKVFEKDMLFATLETTVRKIEPEKNKAFLLSDTVGFIHKLPHGLVKAFRSTLEEVKEADLLLFVVDYSDIHYREQIEVTRETIKELEAQDKPVLLVYNKSDKAENVPEGAREGAVIREDAIYMSAKRKSDIEALQQMILKKVYSQFQQVTFLFPYSMAGMVNTLNESAQEIKLDYLEEGILVTALCGEKLRNKYAQYIQKE